MGYSSEKTAPPWERGVCGTSELSRAGRCAVFPPRAILCFAFVWCRTAPAVHPTPDGRACEMVHVLACETLCQLFWRCKHDRVHAIVLYLYWSSLEVVQQSNTLFCAAGWRTADALSRISWRVFTLYSSSSSSTTLLAASERFLSDARFVFILTLS